MRLFTISAAVLALASLASTGLAQTVRTVASSAGPGVWASPFATVQAALAVSVSGDEVWVKTGTYTAPTAGYALPSGVLLRGGFAGTEQVIADRSADASTSVTTLSGNSRTTMILSGAGAGTLVDRFKFINGRATTTDGHGGAMHILNSSVTIRDCVFDGNSSFMNGYKSLWAAWNGGDGGAIWMSGSNPVIERCSFLNNLAAPGNGGGCASGTTAIAEYGGSGGAVAMVSSTAIFNACTFTGNFSGNGGTGPGCVSQTGTGGAAGNGGAVAGTASSAEFADCTFTNNRTGNGGGGGTRNGVGSPAGAGGAGGAAAFSAGGVVVFERCTFLTNQAGSGGVPGSGASVSSPTPTKEGGAGGAIWTSALTNISISRCVFDGNKAGNGSNGSDSMGGPSIGGAGGAGGALALGNTPGTIANSLLVRNAPGNGGAGSVTPAGAGGPAGSGAIQVGGSPSLLSIVNVTSTLNVPGSPGNGVSEGGASYCTELWAPGASVGSVVVRNSVLWEGAAQTIPPFNGTADFAYCLITGVSGTGVVAAAPTFVNATSDFHLAARSRGIDAGDNTATGVSDPDLGGSPRFREDSGIANTGVAGGAGGASIVDIGAYEFQGTSPHCPADFDSSGNLAVADIFAFLNAWFAGDPSADFNGGGLAVSDIFDFLNAWFAGC